MDLDAVETIISPTSTKGYYGYLDFDEDDYYLEAYTRINIHGISIPKKKITKTLDLQP